MASVKQSLLWQNKVETFCHLDSVETLVSMLKEWWREMQMCPKCIVVGLKSVQSINHESVAGQGPLLSAWHNSWKERKCVFLFNLAKKDFLVPLVFGKTWLNLDTIVQLFHEVGQRRQNPQEFRSGSLEGSSDIRGGEDQDQDQEQQGCQFKCAHYALT